MGEGALQNSLGNMLAEMSQLITFFQFSGLLALLERSNSRPREQRVLGDMGGANRKRSSVRAYTCDILQGVCSGILEARV